jgi:hypothetical protein
MRDIESEGVAEFELLTRIAVYWRSIGKSLGIEDHKVEEISKRPRHRDCLRDVLLPWVFHSDELPKAKKYPVTWQGLFTLLIDSDPGDDRVIFCAVSYFKSIEKHVA